MAAIGWVTTVAVAAALIAGVVIGVKSAPDVKRYLKMRRM